MVPTRWRARSARRRPRRLRAGRGRAPRAGRARGRRSPPPRRPPEASVVDLLGGVAAVLLARKSTTARRAPPRRSPAVEVLERGGSTRVCGHRANDTDSHYVLWYATSVFENRSLCASGSDARSPDAEAMRATRPIRRSGGLYPLAFAAEQVAPADVEVTSLTPPGVEPHDLELAARDVGRGPRRHPRGVFGAASSPPWSRPWMTGTGPRSTSSSRWSCSKAPGTGRARDPHVWLDPLRFQAIARAIAEALGRPSAADALATRLRSSTASTAGASPAASAESSSRATPHSATSPAATASSRSRCSGSRRRPSPLRRESRGSCATFAAPAPRPSSPRSSSHRVSPRRSRARQVRRLRCSTRSRD